MDAHLEPVLIVDDESTIRSLLEKHAQNLGYTTATADNGRSALEMIAAQRFEIVLLDLKMPGFDGLEVLKALRRDHSPEDLPVIMISVMEEKSCIPSALNLGANDYIQKPVDPAVLASRIETQLNLKHKAQVFREIEQDLERRIALRTDELDRINQKLERDRCHFEYLLNSSPAVTYIVSLEAGHGCSYISENTRSITGYRQDEILGRGLWSLLVHPEDQSGIEAEIRQNLTRGSGKSEYRLRQKDGSYCWVHDQYRVKVENGAAREIVGSLIDITVQKELDSKSPRKTTHDELTGLINRREFEKRMAVLGKWADAINYVFCYLDLDEFKIINNSHGHVAGDQLLREIAGLISNTLSKRDLAAYMSGDEFGLLLQNCTLDQAQRVLQELRAALREYRFKWDGKSHVITASIGVVSVDTLIGGDIDFLGAAISACDLAKEGGGDRIQLYADLDETVRERKQEMLWVEKVNRALEEDRFLLHYQPIVPICNSSLDRHFELLIRMKDDNGELVAPGNFLPAVERYRLSGKIDRWVIQTAFSWLDAYREYLGLNYKWGINLSGQSLADPELLDFVSGALEHYQIPPDRIYFEVTETAAVENMTNATKFIHALRETGCQFALDDFGSGLSSFAYLKNLAIDYLKIDGLFVRDMADNEIDCAMVKAISEVGQAMGMSTIAEFVENAETREKLEKIGVDYAQGYGIDRPKPLHEFVPE